jgi:hexosaminidase
MKNVFFAVMALAVSFTETRAADSPAIVPMPQHIAYATGEGAVLRIADRCTRRG